VASSAGLPSVAKWLPFVHPSHRPGQWPERDIHREVKVTTMTTSSLGGRNPSIIVPRRAALGLLTRAAALAKNTALMTLTIYNLLR
jgi:hypothetical protein